MSEWRDRCEHGQYDGHHWGNNLSWCPGGRPVTDADIMARAAELADYEAAVKLTIKHLGTLAPSVLYVAWHSAAHRIVEAALGVDDGAD